MGRLIKYQFTENALPIVIHVIANVVRLPVYPRVVNEMRRMLGLPPIKVQAADDYVQDILAGNKSPTKAVKKTINPRPAEKQVQEWHERFAVCEKGKTILRVKDHREPQLNRRKVLFEGITRSSVLGRLWLIQGQMKNNFSEKIVPFLPKEIEILNGG